MASATPSGPDQLPDGPEVEVERISLRGPELRLRSMRFVPPERPFSVTVPDSSSEPAMRRAVPVRVTSEICALPSWAASDCCKSADAEICGDAGCCANAGPKSRLNEHTVTTAKRKRNILATSQEQIPRRASGEWYKCGGTFASSGFWRICKKRYFLVVLLRKSLSGQRHGCKSPAGGRVLGERGYVRV